MTSRHVTVPQTLGGEFAGWAERPAPLIGPVGRLAADGLKPVPAAVLYCFYLFLVLVVFDGYDPLQIRSYLTLSKVFGWVLLLVAIGNARICFARPPAAFWWLSVQVLISSILGLLLVPDQFFPFTISHLAIRVQMLTLFWLSYNLLQREAVATKAVQVLGLAIAALAMLNQVGITATAVETSEGIRRSALDMDLNYIGCLFSIGFLILLGLVYGRASAPPAWYHIVWPVQAIVLWRVVCTGSRGAMLGLACGILVIPLLRKRRLRNAIIGAATLGLAVYLVGSYEIAASRWRRTMEKGSVSDRDVLAAGAWNVFLESPLWGHGATVGQVRLAEYIEGRLYVLSPHNELLLSLIESGILGAVPLALGGGLCLRGAWRARRGPSGVLPLCLVVLVVVMSMSVVMYHRKIGWLILAYGAASGAVAARCSDSRSIPIRGRRGWS